MTNCGVATASRGTRLGRMALACLCVGAAGTVSVRAQAPTRAVKRLIAAAHDARDADLHNDWRALIIARARIDSERDDPQLRPMALYYSAYADYRLSSIAYLLSGPIGQTPLLESAVAKLDLAVRQDSAFVEAQALLAFCLGALIGNDPSRIGSLAPRANAAWTVALNGGASNPRVQLLRAMTEQFLPPQAGGGRDKALARWQVALPLFERQSRPKYPSLKPTWGDVEAFGWLGGAYLAAGRRADAVAVLKRALQLRPDFWWVREVAMPQALNPASP